MAGLVGEFRKKFPGIDVQLEREAGSKGADRLLQELRAGLRRVDVYEGSDLAASAVIVKRGGFAAVTPANIRDFPASSLGIAPSPVMHSLYAAGVNIYVIGYNSKLVSEEEAGLLRQWNGILNPRFKGRISLVEPVFGSTLVPLLYIMNKPDMGVGFLRRLRSQQPVIYINSAQARDALVAGQQPIYWGGNWEAAMLTLVQTGAPVRFLYPNPTVMHDNTHYGVLRNAPHPNAARLFFAWILSSDGALALQMPFANMRPAMRAVPERREIVFKLLQDSPWFELPKALWQPNIDDWIENGLKYQNLWRAALGYNP